MGGSGNIVGSSQIVENLNQARRELEKERDAEIAHVRARFQEKIDALDRSIAVLRGEELSAEDRRPDVSLSIGDDKLDTLRQFLRRHPEGVRQADIAEATGLNSGSVSVGLRVLHQGKEIEPSDQTVNGSRVWIPVKVRRALEVA